MRFLLFILLLHTAYIAYAQDTPSNISNKLTPEHIRIPGTKVFIIPPAGYKVAKSFIGLEKDGNNGIMIMDAPGGNYYSNTATFTKDAWTTKGATVYEFKEIQLNGYPAKFVHLQGTPPQKSFALVFGDTTFSALIMASYDPLNDQIEKEIKSSLLSIWYEKKWTIDARETARFVLDETVTSFKLANYFGGQYQYTQGGLDTGDTTKPFVLVMSAPNQHDLLGSAGAHIYNLEKYGAKVIRIIKEGETNINGTKAYEVEFIAEIKSQRKTTYILVLEKDDVSVSLVGTTLESRPKDYEELKLFCRTVKIK